MIEGHISITMLRVIEVSEKGDSANWMALGRGVDNISGGMDLAFNAEEVIALTEPELIIAPDLREIEL